MKAGQNREICQIKVTLRDISPPIWRQIQVWEDHALAQLHRILQVVMGWENHHLYEFRIGSKLYGAPDPEFGRKIIDAKRRRIRDVLSGVGTQFEYVYDLGDHWQHDLLLEATLEPAPNTSYPRCIAGERSCPPEDVGSTTGYQNYLQAMADPHHEQHEEMMAWRGPFDPEAFSIEKVNRGPWTGPTPRTMYVSPHFISASVNYGSGSPAASFVFPGNLRLPQEVHGHVAAFDLAGCRTAGETRA